MYYPGGLKQAELYYEESDFLIKQYCMADGKPVLTNGNGFIIDTTLVRSVVVGDIPISSHAEVIDYKVVNSYFIRPNKNDTIYTRAETIAEYPGGFEAFYKNVGSTLTYPRQARRMGIEGTVYVQFIIGKDGQLEDPVIVRGIGAGCDEEAQKAVSTKVKWKPSYSKGKPVKSTMVLPITFKLTGLFSKK